MLVALISQIITPLLLIMNVHTKFPDPPSTPGLMLESLRFRYEVLGRLFFSFRVYSFGNC